ncbi:MAG: ribosome maturation factor RimP [Pseudomonadota bacterium]
MIEETIYNTIIGTVNDLGCDIVRIRILGGGDVTKVVEILIDRLDEKPISIRDCSIVSQNISAVLDVEDIINYAYNLEVSSAGVERPLVKLKDFTRFLGYVAAIKLHKAVNEAKKYQGKILSVDGDKISIDKGQNLSGQNVILDFENIKDAKLVLTEELFRKIIK